MRGGCSVNMSLPEPDSEGLKQVCLLMTMCFLHPRGLFIWHNSPKYVNYIRSITTNRTEGGYSSHLVCLWSSVKPVFLKRKKAKKLPSPQWQLVNWSSHLGLRSSFSEEVSSTNLQVHIILWYHQAPTCILSVTWSPSVLYHVGSLQTLTSLCLFRIGREETKFGGKITELCSNQIKFLIEC